MAKGKVESSSSVSYDLKKVLVSGFLFGNIIHEATRSKNDAEGLLYGNLIHSITDKITDADMDGNHQELKFVIRDIVASETTFSFYNHVGHVMDKDEIQTGSGTFLGWYKVRRNTSNRISLREIAVIKNLIKTCKMNEGLVFLLITPSCKENQSARSLSWSYKCFLCENDKYPVGISLNIINLRDVLNHSEYRYQSLLIDKADHTPNAQSSSQASPLSHVLSASQDNFMRPDGALYEVTHIHNLFQETMKVAKQFKQSIRETEMQIQTHEKEIVELRDKLSKKNKNNNGEDTVMTEEKEDSGQDRPDQRIIEIDDDSGDVEVRNVMPEISKAEKKTQEL